VKNTNSKDEIIELFYYYHNERAKLSDEAKKSWKILESYTSPGVWYQKGLQVGKAAEILRHDINSRVMEWTPPTTRCLR